MGQSPVSGLQAGGRVSERQEILSLMREEKVRFLRLQFTDIDGANKNVEVPENQFEKALDGQILFDGSSIQGFSRIEESDMLLKPDFGTFTIFPWEDERGRVGRLICDVYNPDETPFAGCPRLTLKKVCEAAARMGYTMMVGPEAEFFLFQRDANGLPQAVTHDAAGYFDLTPVDRGEDCRRAIVNALESMHFEVEASHHEVAPGQHEIDFRYADALETADRVTTFRMIVKKIALDYGLHATFMPKPIGGVNGSGMHTHQSIMVGEGETRRNAFYDPDGAYQMSNEARYYIGGLLRHAPAFVAITNPLINSYKRLVPGYEAPVNVAWSEHNRSPLVRVPARRGEGTRVEVRIPDPSCNPYLAFAAMLRSGLDGIANQIDPGEPVNQNIFDMTPEQKKELNITQLPSNLYAAVQNLRQDEVIQQALGDHIWQNFARAKEEVWREYSAQVHQWELDKYLGSY